MVNISVDTEKDSANTIRRVIALLEDELRKKTDGMVSDYSSTPSYSNPSNPLESRKTELNNPFAMFNDDASSTVSSTESAESSISSTENNVLGILDDESGSGLEQSNVMSGNSEEDIEVQPYDEHTTDKIILNAPPKKESSDFEKSSRFADQVSLRRMEKKESDGFFNDLDEY
ncbi:MAG: hypothetical protein U9R00_02220 [Patescibacteria group bacterium]|nr:hypothetical protein [Patescibacteria group bacterium]